MNTYERHGFKNRHEYLRDLAEIHDVDFHLVESLADALGESEDFDGLVNAVEDMEGR